MKNIVGPPVQGDDFFGRKEELEFVWQSLQDGGNILLPSPRRVGKSSFAKKLLSTAKQAGWDTIEINLEKIGSEEEFIYSFTKELKGLDGWKTFMEKGERLLKSLTPSEISIGTEEAKVSAKWKDRKREIHHDFSTILNHETPTLIYFDEVAILLRHMLEAGDSISDVKHLMHWMRELRQTEGSKIRWLFCSSVGIDNFAHQHGMSDTVNDFETYALKAFNETDSVALISKLEADSRLKLTSTIRKSMVQKIEYCLPYFIQLLYKKMSELCFTEQLPINDKLVDQSYKDLLTTNKLNTWVERLEEQYEGEGKDAHTLLKHICQEKKGSKRKNLHAQLMKHYEDSQKVDKVLSKLLHMLTNDGYLMEEEGRHRFRSPLLRDFWHQRHVK